MGYRDDFYIVGNIIGYTGKMGKSPTVYFRCGDESGHITQYHGYDSNVGREEVLSDPNYTYANRRLASSGKTVLVEQWPKHGITHQSRNPLIDVGSMDKGDLAALGQAVWLYGEKKKYTVRNPVRIDNPNYRDGESRVESLIKKFSK